MVLQATYISLFALAARFCWVPEANVSSSFSSDGEHTVGSHHLAGALHCLPGAFWLAGPRFTGNKQKRQEDLGASDKWPPFIMNR